MTKLPLPKPWNDWSAVDDLKVGGHLTFPANLYTQLNNALVFRTRRDGKKFTRRVVGDNIILWRLS
jgi:hypothetical protein